MIWLKINKIHGKWIKIGWNENDKKVWKYGWADAP